jgi:Domain of unknown function (DUF4328)
MICGVCGNYNPVGSETCLRCGSHAATTPAGLPSTPSGASAPQVYSLSWLANALTVLFSITAVLLLIRIVGPTTAPAYSSSGFRLHGRGITALLASLVLLAAIILFLNWFYRARKNAGLTTWRQRWSPGWAIGAWFLPPVLLWFPYQIMADIWRAGRPLGRRDGAGNAALPGLWWALWILAWATSYQHQTTHTDTTSTNSYALNFGGTWLSAAFAAAAAIVLVVIIRTVSAGPVGHPFAPGVPGQMPGDTTTG